MLVYEPAGEAELVAEAMRSALLTVHTVSLTYAARDSSFDGTEIKEGDYLAMLENRLLTTGAELEGGVTFEATLLVSGQPVLAASTTV